MVINSSFWKGRRVFVTGHTGFKGGWLAMWLKEMEAEVFGYALQPPISHSLFHEAKVSETLSENVFADICDGDTFKYAMQSAKPEIVIHMAAQALVRDSYADPVGTYATNVMGTVNLLEAVRHTPSVKAVLNVTTDKCYQNNEWVWGYRENEPMGGHDPYSSSKGCAELVSSAYRRSFLYEKNIALATARAGNVIGGGDWAKDRIVPDAIRSFIDGKSLMVRNPMAIRPWQHVLDPLRGYLMLCEQLFNQPRVFSQSWNFGPNDEDAKPVSIIANTIARQWGAGAQWLQDEGAHPHEARYLKLDCSKAKSELRWQPLWSLESSLDATVRWYKAWYQNSDMHEFTLQQIQAYQRSSFSLE